MFSYSIACGVISIISLILGTLILAKNTKNQIYKSFFLFCLSISFWSLFLYLNATAKDSGSALLWIKLLHAAAIFIPAFFLYFTYIFLSIDKEKVAETKIIFALCSTVALFSLSPILMGVGYKTVFGFFVCEPKLFYPTYLILFVLIIAFSYYELLRAYMSSLGLKRTQIVYLILATLIGWSGGTANFLINYDINIFPLYPYGNYTILLYTLILAYAILRHRLMDIEVVIRKGILYSALVATIVMLYSALMFAIQQIFQSTTGINNWIATILTAIAIAVGYRPIENIITELTNQYFFRKKYDYQKTLMQSSEAMNILTDIDRLIKLTTRILARRMELEEASTLVYEENQHKYFVKAAEGKSKDLIGMTLSDNHEIFKQLFNNKQILIRDEVNQTLNSKLLMPDEKKRLNLIKKEMERLHAQICVPSIPRGKYMGNKLVAVFCLGEKKSGDAYSNDDIQLLTTLSNQAAVAVENALMYSDLMKQFQELKTTKDQLVQSEKLAALGTMAAGIAHEIRNPLTSLQLFSQMMAQRFDDHEFREKFTQIVPPEIERLNRIVNDLVSFAKPSKLLMEPAQIKEVLEKAIRLSEISFKKLNVKVIKEFNEVPPVTIDQQKIMQIFLNLLMNGAQAMQTGGTLTVKTYINSMNGKVAIDVTDTGSGISPETLKKLFSPFFTTKEGGTGLGLAITRRIVEEHKGEIKVKSKVGEGTTFTVELSPSPSA
jgi:signal transduction histidine kinase